MASSLKKVEAEVHTLINKIKVLESPQHKPNKRSTENVLPVSTNTGGRSHSGNPHENIKEKKHVKQKKQSEAKSEKSKQKQSFVSQPRANKAKEIKSEAINSRKGNSESDTDTSKTDSEKLFKSNQPTRLLTKPSNTSTVAQRSITR